MTRLVDKNRNGLRTRLVTKQDWVAAGGGGGSPGTPALLQSFALENWNSSGTSSGFARQGVPFVKGDVPTGTSVQIKAGSTVVPAQFDERTYWSDGSLKFCVMHLRDTTFTASASRTYDVWTVPGTAFTNTGTKALSDVTGTYDFKVAFTSLTETNDTPTTTAVGSGAFTASFNTHAGTATRVEKIHSGSVCEGWLVWGMATDNTGGAADAHLKTNWYVDLWKNTDGSIYAAEFAAVVAQDWWSIANKRRRNYDATLKNGSTTIQSYTGVQHPYRSQWITCQVSTNNNRGRRHMVGGANSTLTYKPSKTYWVASGVVPPLDTTFVPSTTYDLSTHATSINYVPCSSQEHRGSIDGTGAYMGRGLLPDCDTRAFLRQDPATTAAARINSHAGLHVFYHYRSNRTRTRPGDGSADIANTTPAQIMAISDSSHLPYDFTASGMPTPVYAYADGRSSQQDSYVVPQGGGGAWDVTTGDASHAVNYSGYMYLLEGERYHLEATIDLAANCIIQGIDNIYSSRPYNYANYNPNAGAPAVQYDAIANFVGQERATGWAMNLMALAAGLVPASHVASGYLKRLSRQQGVYCRDSLVYHTPSVIAAGVDIAVEGVSAAWMLSMAAQGCYFSGYLNEDADQVAWGHLRSNMAARSIVHSGYATGFYRSTPQQKGGWWHPTTNPALTGPARAFTPYGGMVIRASDGVVTMSAMQGDQACPIAPANGDVMWSFSRNDVASPVSVPVEFPEGTPYYVVQRAGALTFKLSATPGGAPISVAADRTATFSCVVTAWADYSVATNPPYLYGGDSYPYISYAALVMAYRAGNPNATLALVNKLKTFLGGADTDVWGTWRMAV